MTSKFQTTIENAPEPLSVEYCTPGTRLWWGSIAAWVAAAHRIDRRRFSSARNRALKAHAAALPLELIAKETDRSALEEAVRLLKYGPPDLRRPPQGDPADAPQTPIIMALNNRISQLDRVRFGHNRGPGQ